MHDSPAPSWQHNKVHRLGCTQRKMNPTHDSRQTYLRGYVSLSMMTRLILHTLPWSTLAMPALFIMAMPTATASPLVVMMTTSSSTSMPDSNLEDSRNQ